jgi:hypothetical protein
MLTDTELVYKLDQFAYTELQELDKISKLPLIIPMDQNIFRVKDWTMKILDSDTVECSRGTEKIIFNTRQCAAAYLFFSLTQRLPVANKVRNLDESILYLRSDSRLLSHQIKKAKKIGDYDRVELLDNKLSLVRQRLSLTINTIKKYVNLAKYNKGFRQ